MPIVFVAIHESKFGSNVSVYANEADAENWRRNIAADSWAEIMTDPAPADAGELADAYFHRAGELADEFFSVEHCEIEGTAPGGDHTPLLIAAIHDARNALLFDQTMAGDKEHAEPISKLDFVLGVARGDSRALAVAYPPGGTISADLPELGAWAASVQAKAGSSAASRAVGGIEADAADSQDDEPGSLIKTDGQLVAEANDLARHLATLDGWEVENDFRWYDADPRNSRAKHYWAAACSVLELRDGHEMTDALQGYLESVEIAEAEGYEVRHDMRGFYACTTEEGEHEDAGNNSVGFDGRPHFASIELAWEHAADAGSIAREKAALERLKPSAASEPSLGARAKALGWTGSWIDDMHEPHGFYRWRGGTKENPEQKTGLFPTPEGADQEALRLSAEDAEPSAASLAEIPPAGKVWFTKARLVIPADPLVYLYENPDGAPTHRVRLSEAFPDADEHKAARAALLAAGSYWTGGGAAPFCMVALVDLPDVESLIEAAGGIADRDEAIRPIMDRLGITDGDMAGLFFSVPYAANWPNLKVEDRIKLVRLWLKAEDNLVEMDAGRAGRKAWARPIPTGLGLSSAAS